MTITYKDTKEFNAQELQDLFLSVHWSSGYHPEKLVIAMQNYSTVYSAWDGEKLVGLISVMDDGIMTAYIHYLLVDPDYQYNGIGKELIERVLKTYQSYLRISNLLPDAERLTKIGKIVSSLSIDELPQLINMY